MPYLQGALVVIDNGSGGIRALVGGRDYAQSKFNRALAAGESPDRLVLQAFRLCARLFTRAAAGRVQSDDGPIEPGEIRGGGTGRPGNSDNKYNGIQPASYGLIHSRNTMSVRVGEFAGVEEVQKEASIARPGRNIPRGPATYIGSFETNLKDLTSAYSVFPNARHAETILHHRAD